MSSLRGLRTEMQGATKDARGLLNTLKLLGSPTGMGSAANPLRAVRVETKGMVADLSKANREAKSLVSTLSRPINLRVNGTGGMAGGGAAGARGGFFGGGGIGRAIERSLAVTSVYMAGRAAETLAASDYRAIRAGSITGTSAREQQSIRRDLMRRYNMRSEAGSQLGLAVAQIGAKGQAGSDLANSAAAFSRVEEGVAPEDVAKSVYRLAIATRSNPSQYKGITSAILRAGDISPAGPEEVSDMLRGIQSALTMGRFTASEGIGLASALAGIDPNSRESARGSLIRMFADPKISGIARGMASAGGLANPGAASGGQVLAALGGHLAGMSPEGRIAAMSQLTNVRDRKFLIDLSNTISEFAQNSREAAQQIANGGQYLDQQMEDYRRSTKGRIDQLRSSLDELGHTVLDVVGPALQATLSGATASLQGMSGNPMLTGAALAGAGLYFARRTGVGGRIIGAIGGQGARYTAMRMSTTAMGLPASFSRASSFYTGTFGKTVGGAASRAMMGQGAGRFLATPLRMAGGALGTTMGELGLGRLLVGRLSPLAATPVGAIATGLGLLEPVFGGLAAMTREAGKGGGAMGALANSMSFFFAILQKGGQVVNLVMDGIVSGIEAFLNLPGIKQIVDFTGTAFGAASDFVSSLGGGGGSGPKVQQTYNVRVGSPTQFQRLVDTNATRSVRGTTVATYQPGA
jgi:hypothetical protein